MALTKEDLQAIQEALQPQFDTMASEIKLIRHSVVKLEELPHQIQLIAEGHIGLSQQINKLQNTVDNMAPTVKALDILHQVQKQVAAE